jgi:hypothetical protein
MQGEAMQLTENHAQQLQRRLAILSPKSVVTLAENDGEKILSVDEGEWEIHSDQNEFILYALVNYPGSYDNPPEQDLRQIGTFRKIGEVAETILTSALKSALYEVEMDELHEAMDSDFDAMNPGDPHNVD